MRKYLHAIKIEGGDVQPDKAVFLTLTSKADREWSDIMTAWQAMVRWMRLSNPDLAYVAVKEEGSKTGMKHLHVLLTPFTFVPQKQLSAAWSRYSGASVVWIERMTKKVSWAYLTKYLTKDLIGASRLVNYSRNWPKLPPAPTAGRLLGRAPASEPPPVAYSTHHGYLSDAVHPDCDCWGEWEPIDDRGVYSLLRQYQTRAKHPPPIVGRTLSKAEQATIGR